MSESNSKKRTFWIAAVIAASAAFAAVVGPKIFDALGSDQTDAERAGEEAAQDLEDALNRADDAARDAAGDAANDAAGGVTP
ncbi:MAG: hypothetical protein AB8G96_01335 [Phycisphaerales bacterium]